MEGGSELEPEGNRKTESERGSKKQKRRGDSISPASIPVIVTVMDIEVLLDSSYIIIAGWGLHLKH